MGTIRRRSSTLPERRLTGTPSNPPSWVGERYSISLRRKQQESRSSFAMTLLLPSVNHVILKSNRPGQETGREEQCPAY